MADRRANIFAPTANPEWNSDEIPAAIQHDTEEMYFAHAIVWTPDRRSEALYRLQGAVLHTCRLGAPG